MSAKRPNANTVARLAMISNAEPAPEIITRDAETSDMCAWFAMCGNDADHLVRHPAFPNGVAACTRCVTRAGQVHNIIANRIG